MQCSSVHILSLTASFLYVLILPGHYLNGVHARLASCPTALFRFPLQIYTSDSDVIAGASFVLQRVMGFYALAEGTQCFLQGPLRAAGKQVG